MRRRARLAPGDTVLFYTDGLTEALDGAGRFFGLEQVKQLLMEHRAETPEAVRESLLASMQRHAGAGSPSDDVTLIVLSAE